MNNHNFAVYHIPIIHEIIRMIEIVKMHFYTTLGFISLSCINCSKWFIIIRTFLSFSFFFQVQQIAQQLQQLQKSQHQQQNVIQQHQHNTSIPSNNTIVSHQTQTTPPNNAAHIPASLLTPSTPGSVGLTPQHIKNPSRLLEPSPEETTDLEELEQFAKTFKQRRIKLGWYSFHFSIRYTKIFNM